MTPRDPREIFGGGPKLAVGPKLCPVKTCLDGDGSLAPGRMATRALNRKLAQANTHCSTDRARGIRVPDTEQTRRTARWK